MTARREERKPQCARPALTVERGSSVVVARKTLWGSRCSEIHLQPEWGGTSQHWSWNTVSTSWDSPYSRLSELGREEPCVPVLSCFNPVRLFANQAPLSMGFSQQECWSRLPRRYYKLAQGQRPAGRERPVEAGTETAQEKQKWRCRGSTGFLGQ